MLRNDSLRLLNNTIKSAAGNKSSTIASMISATGIKEYSDKTCWLGFDVDAGPIILNLSPSGTAFAIGPSSFFGDSELRTKLLMTAEIAGSSWSWKSQKHYLLADFAMVGEAITLAMKTSVSR